MNKRRDGQIKVWMADRIEFERRHPSWMRHYWSMLGVNYKLRTKHQFRRGSYLKFMETLYHKATGTECSHG